VFESLHSDQLIFPISQVEMPEPEVSACFHMRGDPTGFFLRINSRSKADPFGHLQPLLLEILKS
jgi:hypothetical protein